MDSDFFGFSGETTVQQQYGQAHFQSQDNAPDDEFQFNEPTHYIAIETVQTNNTAVYPDNQAILRIQQEELRIQDMLRQKANREYEEKQRRREQGRRQYEQFLSRKQQQTADRKLENVEKQKKLFQKNAKLSQQAGWRKVAANVPLKQGEHKGAKDTTRMRESIINKRNDESSN